MMMRKFWWIGIVAACFISACQNQTSAVTITPVISATSTQYTRLPPTWTPGPPPTEVLPTNTPPVTIPPALGAAALSALPPTWTPVAVITNTLQPIVTLTDDPYLLTLTAYVPPTLPPPPPTLPLDLPTQLSTSQPPPPPANVTFPADCAKLQIDVTRTTRSVIVGTAATIAWQKVAEADHYQLWVLSPDNVFHYGGATNDDHMSIQSGQLPLAGLYGWELVAYSSNTPICQHLTGVFTVHT